ncbi:MAG TPA: hypothetical protein VGF55_31325 [Gemmataceae bacterium]
MTSPRARLVGVLLAAAVLGPAGCNSGPRLYPVTGKVVNKGKGSVKDLAGYIVQFQSTTDPAELPGGTIAEDGTFTLTTRVAGKEVPGVKEGTYRARLMQQPTEGAAPPPLLVHRRYTKFETADLQYTIKPGPNEITIEVERAQ